MALLPDGDSHTASHLKKFLLLVQLPQVLSGLHPSALHLYGGASLAHLCLQASTHAGHRDRLQAVRSLLPTLKVPSSNIKVV